LLRAASSPPPGSMEIRVSVVATVFDLLQEHQQRGEFFSRLCELPNFAE
jgi:hypothetical protein